MTKVSMTMMSDPNMAYCSFATSVSRFNLICAVLATAVSKHNKKRTLSRSILTKVITKLNRP